MELKLEARNVTMKPEWKDEIQQRVDDLDSRHPGIVHARVVVTKNTRHKQHDQEFETLVSVTIPVRQVMTARKERGSCEEAIRAAFTAVDQELTRFREKRAAN